MNINVACVAGRLTRDPQVKELVSGTFVCNVGLAMNRRTKRKGEWVEEPVFVDVTLFGKSAQNLGLYLKKGDPVAFPQCELAFSSWVTDSGEKRSSLYLVARGFEFVNGGKSNRSTDDETPSTDPDESPF